MAEVKQAAHSEKLFTWPTPQDYNEAVQSPSFCFNDADLKNGITELNEFGLPRPISGGFASVYHVRLDAHEYAVRCFLSRINNLQFRYEAITEYLSARRAPWAVPCKFIEQGMLVGTTWFPILKMEWVKGETLGTWLERHIDDPTALTAIAHHFSNLVSSLRSLGIAHGDLQPANIIVMSDGSLRLVDYDGMFVPSLAGARANELGHKNFQHPDRSASHFDAELDNFSAWLISSSLQILQIDPSLWQQLDCGDDALLFRYADLSDPDHSRVFSILEAHSDERIVLIARVMRTLCRGALNTVPAPNTPVTADEALPPVVYTAPTPPEDIASVQIAPRPIHRPIRRQQHRARKVGGGAMAMMSASIAKGLAVDYARNRKIIVYPTIALATLIIAGTIALRLAANDTHYISDWITRQFEPKGISLFESAHESYEAGDLYAADIKFTTITKHFRDQNFGLKPEQLVEAYVHKAEIAHTWAKDTEAKKNFETAQRLTSQLPNNGGTAEEPLYEPDYFTSQILICEIGKEDIQVIAQNLMSMFKQNPDSARWAPWDLARVFSILLDKDPTFALTYWRTWYGAVAQGGYDSHLLADINNLAFANAMRFASSDQPGTRRIAGDIYQAILLMSGDGSTGKQDKIDALAGVYFVAHANKNKKDEQAAIAGLKALGLTASTEELQSYADTAPVRQYTPERFHTD